MKKANRCQHVFRRVCAITKPDGVLTEFEQCACGTNRHRQITPWTVSDASRGGDHEKARGAMRIAKATSSRDARRPADR